MVEYLPSWEAKQTKKIRFVCFTSSSDFEIIFKFPMDHNLWSISYGPHLNSQGRMAFKAPLSLLATMKRVITTCDDSCKNFRTQNHRRPESRNLIFTKINVNSVIVLLWALLTSWETFNSKLTFMVRKIDLKMALES